MPEGTRSLPCWPCRAAAAAAVWTGMATTPRARPPLGQRMRPPRQRRSPLVGGGGGGGGARSMSATDLVAFDRGRHQTRGGDRHRG